MKTDSKQHPDKGLNTLLVIGSIACICLLMVRTYITSNLHYYFLIWNLLLACIPFVLSTLLTNTIRTKGSNWKTGLLFFAWLLFFPNAPYIITDLFHLHQPPLVPLWFNLVVIVSFGWTGLMSIQRFLHKKFSFRSSWGLSLLFYFCADLEFTSEGMSDGTVGSC